MAEYQLHPLTSFVMTQHQSDIQQDPGTWLKCIWRGQPRLPACVSTPIIALQVEKMQRLKSVDLDLVSILCSLTCRRCWVSATQAES